MEKKQTNKKNTTLVQREDMSSANMSFRQTINGLLYVTYPGEKMKSTTLVMKLKKKEFPDGCHVFHFSILLK